MKKILKYLLFGAIIAFAPILEAQKLYFPTNVRYIGGGYINKAPYFRTLEAALNHVKPFATSENPYGFWVDSDTLWIADWDSVFTESGLTMKDSIDIYYVAEGKIKWMPFGFGGTGGGGGTIIQQDTETFHYEYPNWNQYNIALPIWQRRMGTALDSIDQHIFDLIVYTGECLYIENDTLKIDVACLEALIATQIIDTATYLRTSGNQVLEGPGLTLDGVTLNLTNSILNLGIDSYIRYPVENYIPGVSRVMWSIGNRPFWSGSGGAGDTLRFAMMKGDTLEQPEAVSFYNLTPDVQNRFPLAGVATFNGTDTTVYVATGDSTNLIILQILYDDSTTIIDTDDNILVVIPGETGFTIKRRANGLSDLKVAWIRRKL